MVFHVLNRGVGRRVLFTKDEDFLAFERVVEETLRTRRMRLWAYCLMPNHWHFVVWPERDGDLPAFMQQVTNTHVKRWKEHRHEIGYGHLYQGRYQCFPVETEDYFYQVVRYVERNALRANLVEQAESWRWSSLRRVEREDTASPSSRRGLCLALPIGCNLSTSRKRKPKWRRCGAPSIAVGPSAIPTGSQTRPSDWGWKGRFGPVEDRRNNHRLATVTGGAG
jgi:REP element-mobilizing transposase RayT